MYLLCCNPRSREGSDKARARRNINDFLFQSTLPRRERQTRSIYDTRTRVFQSTLPRRERHYFIDLLSCYDSFNPRSREGSDEAVKEFCDGFKVSIHAPAKGATKMSKLEIEIPDVSIHAPAKGATCIRKRGRNGRSVSIHAPAKGATGIPRTHPVP